MNLGIVERNLRGTSWFRSQKPKRQYGKRKPLFEGVVGELSRQLVRSCTRSLSLAGVQPSEPMNVRKRLLLFAMKLGYQTRAFNATAEKLGVDLGFVTDRCNRLDDPWNDGAIAVHFENAE